MARELVGFAPIYEERGGGGGCTGCLGVAFIVIMLIAFMFNSCTAKQEEEKTAKAYERAVAMQDKGDYSKARDTFSSIRDYQDSDMRYEYCTAVVLQDQGDYEGAAARFEALVDRDAENGVLASDSETRYHACMYSLGEQRERSGDLDGAVEAYYASGREGFSKAEEIAWRLVDQAEAEGDIDAAIERLDKMASRNMSWAAARSTYLKGCRAQDQQDWATAASLFEKRLDLDDSAERFQVCRYSEAHDLESARSYGEAAAAYESLGDYQDAASRATYTRALQASEDGDHEAARDGFASLGDFEDAATRALYESASASESAGDFTAAATAFAELGDYLDSANRGSYCQALALKHEGDHAGAAAAFASLGDYRDSSDLAAYCSAEALEASGDLLGAADAFAALGSYSDASERASAARYAYAESLLESGAASEAAEAFMMLTDNADAQARAWEILSSGPEAWHEGMRITYGAYEQDGNSDNGAEPLTWTVLRVENDAALVVSDTAIDARAFASGSSSRGSSITWETSDLRAWLGDEFLVTAFDKSVRPRILAHGGVAGTTTDRVFVLSEAEARELLTGDVATTIVPATPYAQANGIFTSSDGLGAKWWLRDAKAGGDVTIVNADGGIIDGGAKASDASVGVRPAMWLAYQADVATTGAGVTTSAQPTAEPATESAAATTEPANDDAEPSAADSSEPPSGNVSFTFGN